jgi:hypothetical protein
LTVYGLSKHQKSPASLRGFSSFSTTTILAAVGTMMMGTMVMTAVMATGLCLRHHWRDNVPNDKQRDQQQQATGNLLHKGLLVQNFPCSQFEAFLLWEC